MVSRRSVLAAAWALACSVAPGRADKPVTLFAAASLKTALDQITTPLQQQTGLVLRNVYGSSASLARQIDEGAPADLFWPADREWMQWCVNRHLIERDSIDERLGNRLVVVAPKNSALNTLALTPSAITAALAEGRLATGETRSVPAGRYAREALQSLGLWESVASRLAETDNVRAALLLTARGETPLGLVYASDAHAEPRVKIVADIPNSSHKPIFYPLAMTQNAARPTARQVVAFMRTATAEAIFRAEGFLILSARQPA